MAASQGIRTARPLVANNVASMGKQPGRSTRIGRNGVDRYRDDPLGSTRSRRILFQAPYQRIYEGDGCHRFITDQPIRPDCLRRSANVNGLLRLYDATHDTNYLKLAGWRRRGPGNNSPREQMYDPVTGRCFDGIQDSASVNKNAGAESTIEALMALVELEHYPFAEEISITTDRANIFQRRSHRHLYEQHDWRCVIKDRSE